MSLSRRDFLRWGALTTAVTATGCSVVGRQLVQDELPETLSVPGVDEPLSMPQSAVANDHVWRLLNRAGYGPRPGEIERVREVGFSSYLEEQLAYEQIDDTNAELALSNLSLVQMDLSQLIEQEPRDAGMELGWSTIGRRAFSKRQLYEAMVEFWSDHFHIYLQKNMRMPLLKLVDDRDVIRPYALGTFRELLAASVRSPAMLVYLDNIRNLAKEPNENYGRELLELHTVGVHAGYTQADVQAVARVLTGLGVGQRGAEKGMVRFRRAQHDEAPKLVMGQTIHADDGDEEIDQLIGFLASHPQTADFIATKLVRRFVADDPPESLVSRVAQTFLETDGDIKSLLRVIFLSDEFAEAPPKLKRPLTYLISAVRAVHGDISYNRQLLERLRLLGQLPFMWPAPNGFPDVAAAWASNLLPRWNFAIDFTADDVRGLSFPYEDVLTAGSATQAGEALDLFAHLLWGQPLSGETRTILMAYVGEGNPLTGDTAVSVREAIALMMASPQFQWV